MVWKLKFIPCIRRKMRLTPHDLTWPSERKVKEIEEKDVEIKKKNKRIRRSQMRSSHRPGRWTTKKKLLSNTKNKGIESLCKHLTPCTWHVSSFQCGRNHNFVIKLLRKICSIWFLTLEMGYFGVPPLVHIAAKAPIYAWVGLVSSSQGQCYLQGRTFEP